MLRIELSGGRKRVRAQIRFANIVKVTIKMVSSKGKI